MRGRASPRYGTHRAPLGNGYMRVWVPGHPIARRDGYALEHRYVLHEAGVVLEPGMVVHHRNGDKLDNRLENLELMTMSDHMRMHSRERTPTHCPRGHAYTDENTAFSRGWRYCKQCNRDRARRHRETRRLQQLSLLA